MREGLSAGIRLLFGGEAGLEGAISSRIVYTEEARGLQELWSGLTVASYRAILAVKEIRLGGYFPSANAWAVGEPKAVRPPRAAARKSWNA